MANQGQVGLQLQGDGQIMNIRTTNDGAVVVTEGYGKYAEVDVGLYGKAGL